MEKAQKLLTQLKQSLADISAKAYKMIDEHTTLELEHQSLKELYEQLFEKHTALLAEFEQYKKESVKWSIEDFQDTAQRKGYTITDEQAQKALEDMIHHHDCQYGITWDTIDSYVQDYGEKISDARIAEFLDTFCTQVKDDEEPSYVDLMMDDHFCIEYEVKYPNAVKWVQYYVPENNMMYGEEDEYIMGYLREEYGL